MPRNYLQMSMKAFNIVRSHTEWSPCILTSNLRSQRKAAFADNPEKHLHLFHYIWRSRNANKDQSIHEQANYDSTRLQALKARLPDSWHCGEPMLEGSEVTRSYGSTLPVMKSCSTTSCLRTGDRMIVSATNIAPFTCKTMSRSTATRTANFLVESWRRACW